MPGRGYAVPDLALVQVLGVVSGYLSVLVFALYTHGPETADLYAVPKLLWLICPLLIHWISRIWLLASRGLMHDDPLVFAVRDFASLVTGCLVILLVVLATVPLPLP